MACLVLIPSATPLNQKCAIAAVLEGLTQDTLANQRPGWYLAIQQQYGARLLPGASRGWDVLTHMRRANSCSGVRHRPTAACAGSLQEAAHEHTPPKGMDGGASAVPAQGPGEAPRGQMENWGGCSGGTGTCATSWGGTSGTGAKHEGGNTMHCPSTMN